MSVEDLFSQLATIQLDFIEDSTMEQGVLAELEQSQNYKFNGANMTSDVGIAIPIVYGRHKVAPNLVNVFIEEGENETINMLLAVCEGEIEGISNIKLNGTPIENFYGEVVGDPYGENAEVTTRPGSLTQETIENFDDTNLITPVLSTLTKGSPVVFTTAGSEVEAFQIEFNILRLFQTDDSQNQIGWFVAVQIEYKLTTDSDYIFAGIHNFSKNTTSSFKRYFKSEYLSPGKYDIRVTRVSDNSDATHKGELVLNSVSEITTQKLRYPGTAMLGIRVVASEKLNNETPNVTCVVTGTKVRVPDVRNALNEEVGWEDYYYDGTAGTYKLLSNDSVLTWDGTTYITRWTANPVWCLRDLLTNDRYGLGEFIDLSRIDEESFLASARYCDEGVSDLDGNTEKRLRIDTVIDVRGGALDILYRLTNVFRGRLHISSSTGKIRLVIEKREDPVFMFTMGNIVRESFSIVHDSKDTIPNVVKIDYTNKDKNYERDTVEDGAEEEINSGDEIIPEHIQLIGCTRTSQALREGRIRLNKARLNRIKISFSAGRDAKLLQVNDVIEFQHDLPAWGEGGRVQTGSTNTVVKLDKTVDLDVGETYEIAVKNSITDEIETRTVITGAGQTDEITVGTPFTFQPQAYDIYNFGIEGFRMKEYRIMSITKQEVVSIQAVEYNDDAYDFSNIQTPQDNFTYLTLEIPSVTDLTAEERVVRLASGEIDLSVNVSFTKAPTGARWIRKVIRYQIYLSDDNGKSWNFVSSTDKEKYPIKVPFTVGSRYTVAVVSEIENGEAKLPSNSPQISLVIEGWKNSPANVSGLGYTFEDEIKLTWDKIDDADLFHYEIRTEDDNFGVKNSKFIWAGKSESYTIVRPEAREGIVYYVRALNSSGIYSDVSAQITPINPAPTAPSLTFINVFQKAYLMWEDSTDADLVEYEVWTSDSGNFTGEQQDSDTENERLVQKSQGTSATVILEFSPISYFRVRAIDKFGGGEFSNVVEISQTPIVGGDIGNEAIGSDQLATDSVTANKILAGSIQASHISALSVTAEKISVACLSGISANLGEINAGTIVGALIKTSNQCERTEMTNAGIFSYDCCGLQTIKLEAGQLCLISSIDSGFWSFLDSGALKFHHPYGEVPYVKRICSDEASAGSTVTLCQWYERPEVTLGIKQMKTYDSTCSPDCQEWCVFTDNIRRFNNGGADFGWKFDVHATLHLSGGTYPETVHSVGFDITKTSNLDVCEILYKDNWQMWCHADAPSNYFYGQSCFEIRYRVAGCGVWCSAPFEYNHPHPTAFDIERTYLECQQVGFGCSDQWETELHENSFAFIDSGVQFGEFCCCICTCFFPVDCSFTACCQTVKSGLVTGHSVIVSGVPFTTCCCNYVDTINLGSWDEVEHPVCCSCVCYNVTRFLSGYADQGCFSVGRSMEFTGGAVLCACNTPNTVECCYYFTGQSTVCFALIPSVNFVVDIFLYTGADSGLNWATASSACYNITRTICYKQCCICCCQCQFPFCVWVGVSACCNFKEFFSQTDVKGTQCVLDPNGLVNYLAIAYA